MHFPRYFIRSENCPPERGYFIRESFYFPPWWLLFFPSEGVFFRSQKKTEPPRGIHYLGRSIFFGVWGVIPPEGGPIEVYSWGLRCRVASPSPKGSGVPTVSRRALTRIMRARPGPGTAIFILLFECHRRAAKRKRNAFKKRFQQTSLTCKKKMKRIPDIFPQTQFTIFWIKKIKRGRIVYLNK